MAIGMGVSRHFVLYLVLMALYGIALTTVQTTITTMLQENSEVSMQGRVFGLMSSLYSVVIRSAWLSSDRWLIQSR